MVCHRDVKLLFEYRENLTAKAERFPQAASSTTLTKAEPMCGHGNDPALTVSQAMALASRFYRRRPALFASGNSRQASCHIFASDRGNMPLSGCAIVIASLPPENICASLHHFRICS
jgi:hypothetical protein